MSQISIVVPTYWTWPQSTPAQPHDAIYDHPTPVDQDGTLGRLLHSLANINKPTFNVIILTAATNPQIEETVHAKVETIIEPYRSAFPILHFTVKDLTILTRRVQELGFSDMPLSMQGYGNIRNLQLIIPHILGSEIVVALDDDEIVEVDYLTKATTFIGKPAPDNALERVLGLAGFYLDEHGNKTVAAPQPMETDNLFWRKNIVMNDGVRQLDAKPERLVASGIAYGGNMIFTRQLWGNVSFDPWITRGEDIDYLINARFQGIRWWLDKEATIVHLPPQEQERVTGQMSFQKLIQDIQRFIYERIKIEMAQSQNNFQSFDPAVLDPYPGFFLRGTDSELNVNLQAQEALAPIWHQLPEHGHYQDSADFICAIDRTSQHNAPRYFAFANQWKALMTALATDQTLSTYFCSKIRPVPQ